MKHTFTLPTLAVIYLAALVVITIQKFAELSFGTIGFLSWVIVIVGSVAFIIVMLGYIFD